MPELYAQNFDLKPKPGLSGAEAFLSIVRAWVKDKWPREQPWLRLAETESLKLPDGTVFRWEPYFSSGSDVLLEFTFRHADVNIPDLQWSTQCALFSNGENYRLALRVSNTGPDFGQMGFRQTTRPRIVLYLHKYFDVLGDNYAQSGRLESLTPSKIDDFVNYVLLDKARSYPIVIVSPKSDGTFVATPEKLVDEFSSLASVVKFSSVEASVAFTRAIGSRFLSCFNGGIRIYFPSLAKDSDPLEHPLLVGARASLPHERLRLAQYLSYVASKNYKGDPRLDYLRDERTIAASARHKLLEEELKKAKAGDSDKSTWEALAESYSLENKDLKETLTKRDEEISDANNTIAALRYALSKAKTHPQSTEDQEKTFTFDTVAEVVETAAELFSDDLLFLANAHKSAQDSPFSRPELVWKSLQALQVVAAKKRAEPLGKSLRDAFSDFGEDYRVGLSESTPKKMRSQYRFVEDGVAYQCEEHLCSGVTGDPANCLRIYFSTENGGETRIVVGHVGRHLDVLTTN